MVVKLLDFGVATFRDRRRSLTKAGSGEGKNRPTWPPIQLEECADRRDGSDLFSLGIVMHEMLTLQVPVRGRQRPGTREEDHGDEDPVISSSKRGRSP